MGRLGGTGGPAWAAVSVAGLLQPLHSEIDLLPQARLEKVLVWVLVRIDLLSELGYCS